MKEHFVALAAILKDPLLLVSREGIVLAANAAAAESLGAGELEGRPLSNVVRDTPEELARFLTACERTTSPLAGALWPVNGKGRLVRCEGARLPGKDPVPLIVVRMWPHEDASHVAQLTSEIGRLKREVLDRKLAEAERESALVELGRSVRLGEMLMAVLGHDLRNPLGAIITSAHLALRRTGDASTRQNLERITRSAARMTRMIEQLLDVTRLRLGKGVPLSRAPLDLVEVLGQVVPEVERAQGGRHVDVRVEGDGSGEWDRDRLAQVLSNLVSNACQHSPEDSTVMVRVNGAGAREVVIEVHNEGAPIPAELIPSLFDAFSRTTESRGLGLGLYITHEIVAAHGGRVTVSSSESDGTRFIVSLPRRPTREDEQGPRPGDDAPDRIIAVDVEASPTPTP